MQRSDQKIRVLVLGATGRTARMLRGVWEEKAPRNLAFTWVGRREAPGVDRVWQEGASVESLPQCDVVVALWGVVGGAPETLAQNASLALEAQRIARHCGADRVFHASSAAVYAPSERALDESAELAPRNAYGEAKLRMEQALAGAAPKPVCLRIGNVAGAGGLFDSLAKPDELRLDRFADGSGPRRSYVAPRALAGILETLIRQPVARLPDVLNVGGRDPVAMADILRAAGRDFRWQPAPEGALPVMALDVTRLQALAEPGRDSSDPAELVAQWRRYGGGA